MAVFKVKGLRRRWLLNTVSVVLALGLVCALGITAAFATYYYSAMESDLRFRARSGADFFAEYQDLNYNEYYQSCITYANTFEDKNSIELQFVDTKGRVIASSYGQWSVEVVTTDEVSLAVSTRETESFVGENPTTGEGILAVSSPVIYQSGEVIGVLRYVTSTRIMDEQIAYIALISFAALGAVVLIVLLSSNYYIRSILVPLGEIIEKAKLITGGSYGIQIQKHYDDEIGELADTINEMSIKINQNEKMQTDFISNLSHELRTPLTAITGWSETILNDENVDEDTQRGVKIIHKETMRLTEMVLELLDFTRIQDGRMTLNIEKADIRGEFEDTVYMYGSRLSQEGIKLHYEDSDQDIPEISCDPKRMRQVFLNILDNAAKHGGEGKRIDAAMTFENGLVVVRIRDYGCGIPEDELTLVKKKFYKGSAKARGSGIGLAVCDEIVQMHGGTLTLQNADGGGTLVTVTLPESR